MAWIDASSNVYWTGATYMGGGLWTFPNNGGNDLYEQSPSPFEAQYDEYTYTYTGENVTVSGIRIYYTFELAEGWPNPDKFKFETNYARISPGVDCAGDLVAGSTVQEWLYDPDIDERIVLIYVPWGFGDNYATTAIITKIEVRTSIETERWMDYVGSVESTIL